MVNKIIKFMDFNSGKQFYNFNQNECVVTIYNRYE